VSVVPPPEITVPPPTVVVPPPGNGRSVTIWGKIIKSVATRGQVLRLKCSVGYDTSKLYRDTDTVVLGSELYHDTDTFTKMYHDTDTF